MHVSHVLWATGSIGPGVGFACSPRFKSRSVQSAAGFICSGPQFNFTSKHFKTLSVGPVVNLTRGRSPAKQFDVRLI